MVDVAGMDDERDTSNGIARYAAVSVGEAERGEVDDGGKHLGGGLGNSEGDRDVCFCDTCSADLPSTEAVCKLKRVSFRLGGSSSLSLSSA